jgi:hypothetical protein
LKTRAWPRAGNSAASIKSRNGIRDQRGWPLLDWLMEDVAFGFRLMRKNALFSIPPPDRSRSASTRCRWRSQR